MISSKARRCRSLIPDPDVYPSPSCTTDEKVQIAHQMYDLVDRHLRRLDQELHKFKMELEADHAGITELLERRSLELDVTANESQKENRYSAHSGVSRHSHGERGIALLALLS